MVHMLGQKQDGSESQIATLNIESILAKPEATAPIPLLMNN